MRKYRHLIPIAVFILSLVASQMIVTARRDAIRTMLDYAGRNARPVVYIKAMSRQGITDYILSLDHDPVEIETDDVSFSFGPTFFTESGAVRFVQKSFQSSAIRAWEVPLPDIYAVQGYDTLSEFLRASYNRGLPRFSCDRWVVWVDPDRYIVDDLQTFETESRELESPRPWDLPWTYWNDAELYRLSPDATVIIARQPDSTGFDDIWRYDIENGTWSKIARTTGAVIEAVGPGGEVVCLIRFTNNVSELEFIDGITGETILTVPGIQECVISANWTAYIDRGTDVVILFDREDNWREYRIQVPGRHLWRIASLAIYEPPPGGVEEMLAMRAAEADDAGT